MTERKPPGTGWEPWIEAQIRRRRSRSPSGLNLLGLVRLRLLPESPNAMSCAALTASSGRVATLIADESSFPSMVICGCVVDTG